MTISQYISDLADNFKNGLPTSEPEIEGSSLNMNPEISSQISENLGLAFVIEDNNERKGEVCYANTKDVRPEFRTVFNEWDIFNYVYAILYSTGFQKDFYTHLKNDLKDIPITRDAVIFWKLAASGNELRKIHRLEKKISDENSVSIAIEKIKEKIDNLLENSK